MEYQAVPMFSSCLLFRKWRLCGSGRNNFVQTIQIGLQNLSNFASKQTTKLKVVEQCETYITFMVTMLHDNLFILIITA